MLVEVCQKNGLGLLIEFEGPQPLVDEPDDLECGQIRVLLLDAAQQDLDQRIAILDLDLIKQDQRGIMIARVLRIQPIHDLVDPLADYLRVLPEQFNSRQQTEGRNRLVLVN